MKRTQYLLPLTLVTLLGGCGGSDSDDSSTPLPPPVANTPAVISGALENISGNLLKINGQTLDASAANFPVQGTNLKALRVGMVLDVQTNSKGVATEVRLDTQLKAPVTSIDGNVINIAGIRVLTQGARFADGLSLAAIKPNDRLEISGFFLDSEQLKASYIERTDDTDSELEGIVTALNTTQKTFVLGKVTVDYSKVNVSLKNGSLVEVEGTLNGLTLQATEVELEDDKFTQNDELEFEGLVSWLNADGSSLLLNQQTRVTITPATKFEDGTQAALKVGKLIEVEGIWDTNNNSLVAAKIEFEDTDLSDLKPDQREFEVPGFAKLDADTGLISLNGVSLIQSANIEFDDGLLPTDVNGSTWVKLEGYLQPGSFIVTEIERETQEPTISLEGVVLAKNGQAGLFGYYTVDGSLNSFIDKHGEFECTLGANNELNNCVQD